MVLFKLKEHKFLLSLPIPLGTFVFKSDLTVVKNFLDTLYKYRVKLKYNLKNQGLFKVAFIFRQITKRLKKALNRKKSVLLLGPRQTGKTTLVKNLNANLYVNLARPTTRQTYEKDTGRLTREVEAMTPKFPLVIIDEIQKVTPLLDAVQDLIDSQIAQFVLTGSSARKLRRAGNTNLLPGRVVVLRMDPLIINEMSTLSPSLEELLLYGSLPQIILEKSMENREEDLFSYVTTYLEEEIRSEAFVRNIGAFSNFLKLAALESGSISNFHK